MVMNEDEWIAESRATLISRGISRDLAEKLVSRSDYAKFSEGIADRPSDAADQRLVSFTLANNQSLLSSM
jgi:hypothetical protein